MGKSGRPPKFQEPRRPVTMTLPERILKILVGIEPDRATAVVKVTEAVAGTGSGAFKPVELVEMAPGKSLIVVGPSRALEAISGLKMIEISRTRYLLAIPSGTPIEAFEISLHDLLARPELKEDGREWTLLQDLARLIGHQRRNNKLSKAEVLIIDSR